MLSTGAEPREAGRRRCPRRCGVAPEITWAVCRAQRALARVSRAAPVKERRAGATARVIKAARTRAFADVNKRRTPRAVAIGGGQLPRFVLFSAPFGCLGQRFPRAVSHVDAARRVQLSRQRACSTRRHSAALPARCACPSPPPVYNRPPPSL